MYTRIDKPKTKSRLIASPTFKQKYIPKQKNNFVDNRDVLSIVQKTDMKSSKLEIKRGSPLHSKSKCTQLRITMNGHIYTQLHGNGGFVEAYAHHFHIEPWQINDLVWDYIVHANQHNMTFRSYRELLNHVFVGTNNFLPLNQPFIVPQSRNRIFMTGSRGQDRDAANAFYTNNIGWDWHHIEGISYVHPNWECDMILVDPRYHAQNHIGAVHQWELFTGLHYR